MASLKRQIIRWSNLKQPNAEYLSCVICDYNDLNHKFKKYFANDIFNAGVIVRHQCPNCSLIFGDLRFLQLSEDEINNDYCDTYSYFKEGDGLREKIAALQSITIFKDTSLSILDYACGVGIESAFLLKLGYNIHGYDKYVVKQGVLNNIDNMKFDIIYNINFIEHLIDPIKDIKKILKHLKINGYLIFISDAIDQYKVEITHFHTFYYIGKSLEFLFNKLNLQIIENKSVETLRVIVLQYTSEIL